MSDIQTKYVYNNFADKVAAYNNFLVSYDDVLIVFGVEGGGEGKSAALNHILLNSEGYDLVLLTDYKPFPVMINKYNENYANHDGEMPKIIYHLLKGQEFFMDALIKMYSNVRVVYFARGDETEKLIV